MPSFPIDPFLSDIAAELQKNPAVLLKAEPGAGKTTRVPQALLEKFQRILVVQPRRLAAKLAAERVAEQAGGPCGQLVGYQIRLENKSSPSTRLLFVTEGVLTRKLLQDPELRDFDVVILDEFHERHIHTDIALALLRSIQTRRADLRLLIMSATLDTGALEQYLDGARVFNIPGRTYPVTLEYLPGSNLAYLEDQVYHATARMLEDERCGGNILIFLSGLAEIQRCTERLKNGLGTRADWIPLTADLAGNYRLLLQNEGVPKVVLATNVAETSVTLPGIRGVIDTGKAKISGYAPWSGLPTLETQKVSQASCIQRMGRAGRIAPGICYRLFSAMDFSGRSKFTEPEIKRIDLCQTLLEIQAILPEESKAWETLPWLEAPDEAILQHNLQLLTSLGALDAGGRLTAEGRFMAEFPLHPRLGRIIIEGKKQGIAGAALLAALLISEGMLLRGDENARDHLECDVTYQMELFLQVIQKRNGARRDLDFARMQRLRQLYDSLRRSCNAESLHELQTLDGMRIRRAIFAGFADRVARHRPAASQAGHRKQRHFNFCLGRGAVLNESSVVRDREWLVAIDARETLSEEADTQRGRIFVASAVDIAWLKEDPFHLVQNALDIRLDEKTGRARKVTSLNYGRLLLEETIEQADAAAIQELLFATVKGRWPEAFSDLTDFHSYHRKVEILDRHQFPHKLPRFEGDMLDLLLSHLCEGARSLADVTARSMRQAIEEQLDYNDILLLQQQCPDQITLKNGKKFRIHYDEPGEPFIEGRIQEFFSQPTTPRICSDRQPLLLKLLAPNRRPAQITQDLAGFWQGSYHDVKKELKRRYPKHAWPEDPVHEKPDDRPPRRTTSS
ncbi:MAG TPA: ATP-dependent helicase HrpB [Oligoflexus sp.]|uniref:ATP-dependent helicase HrpB n=1 Tax=Oligoflexus sp. TaxID=1971216 RepID=UPI002D738D21|nr:ATP-dependent helicase HrpB [Oligoflexus sp.]HYX32115.1 ATP-dependent helicase HrpB [Oligoflexus sp.]